MLSSIQCFSAVTGRQEISRAAYKRTILQPMGFLGLSAQLACIHNSKSLYNCSSSLMGRLAMAFILLPYFSAVPPASITKLTLLQYVAHSPFKLLYWIIMIAVFSQYVGSRYITSNKLMLVYLLVHNCRYRWWLSSSPLSAEQFILFIFTKFISWSNVIRLEFKLRIVESEIRSV